MVDIIAFLINTEERSVCTGHHMGLIGCLEKLGWKTGRECIDFAAFGIMDK